MFLHMKLQIISKKRLRSLLVVMVPKMVVLSTFVPTVMNTSSSPKDAIADCVHAVVRDIQISGLIA